MANKLKVLLIAPPEINILPEPETSNMTKTIVCYPPLGLMYIASYMKKNSAHDVSIIDARVLRIGYEDLERRIRDVGPDLVGIQATTFTLKDALLTAKLVKKINPDIYVNIGGVHTTVYPKETLAYPEVDSITIGEGEVTFTELADALAGSRPLETIKGIGFKKAKELVFNTPREFIEDLDGLPFPSRSMLPFKEYHSAVSKSKFVGTMVTSRGCPFNCLFCFTKGRKFRQRSPENVIKELKECIKLGITEFEFYDDTFTVNRKRVMDICDLIIKEKLKIKWAIRARVNTVNYEMLKKLKEAGCLRINYGVEAGTPEILKVIRKGITIEEIKKVFSMTRKLKITTVAYFMIGHPTETREQILKTIEFAKSLKPDYCLFTVAVPFPDTDMYKMGFDTGLYKEDHWLQFAKNPLEPFRPKVWTEKLTEKELLDLLESAYKKFYLTPYYIMKNLLSIRSIPELKRNIEVALNLINFQKE